MDINNLASSQFNPSPEPVTASNASAWQVGMQVSHVAATSSMMLFPEPLVSGKVDRILKQLVVYQILPENLRTQLGYFLKTCQPDERQAVWDTGVKSCNNMECIQLFIDSQLVHEVVNCSDSDGYHAAMRAVQKKDGNMLRKLLQLEDAVLNEPFPSLDGDTLLIRSEKDKNTETFNLLADHLHVDVCKYDRNARSVPDNDGITGQHADAGQFL
jgi:hypothetical protein